VLASIGNPEVSAERQNLEIWRAAYAERGESLEREIGGPLLALACRSISQKLPLSTALASFDETASESGQSSFVLDLARRALIRSSARKDDVQAFVGETFAEIVNYYASRDLSSYIGASGRISNVTESVELKQRLSSITKEEVSSVGRPSTDAEGWKRYVKRVLAALIHEGTRK